MCGRCLPGNGSRSLRPLAWLAKTLVLGRRSRTLAQASPKIAGVRVALIAATAAALLAAGAATSSMPRAGCRPAQTVALVKQFLTAFNQGNRGVLNNQVWGGKAYFNWYAVSADPGMRVDPEARRRDTLMNYFAVRHRTAERLVLTTIKINDISGGGYRNFEFHLTRSADDLRAGPIDYNGKGASSCSTGRLTTWAMTPSLHP
jgi:hypothetical protein